MSDDSIIYTAEEILHEDLMARRAQSKTVAETLSMPHTTLMRQLNPYDPGAKPRIGTFAALMRALGSYRALHHVAAECGFRLVELQGGSKPLDTAGCFRELADCTSALGVLADRIKAALDDSKLSRRELLEIFDAVTDCHKELEDVSRGIAAHDQITIDEDEV